MRGAAEKSESWHLVAWAKRRNWGAGGRKVGYRDWRRRGKMRIEMHHFPWLGVLEFPGSQIKLPSVKLNNLEAYAVG